MKKHYADTLTALTLFYCLFFIGCTKENDFVANNDSNGNVHLSNGIMKVAPISTPEIVNGNFETGSLTNSWTGWGGYSCVNNNQYAGSFCGYVSGIGALEQIITGLEPNTNYAVNAMCKVGSGTSYLKVMDYGDIPIGTPATSTSYVKLSRTFKTGATNTSAKIYLYNPNSNNAWIDNVTITPTVVNGDFETGSLTNSWTGWGGYYCVSNSQYAGSYCGYVWGPGALEQVITGLKPNTTYTIKARCKVGGGTSYLKVMDYGDIPIGTPTSSTSYVLLSRSFTTGLTNTSAKIYLYNPNAQNAWIDDVTITPSSDEWDLVFKDDFNDTSVNTTNWSMYNGVGHGGNGLRKPEAFSVADGLLTVTAQMVNGVLVSGGMSHNNHYTYGKFEFRVKTDADPSNATSGVVLTWPQSGNWTIDGENDIYETTTSSTRNPFQTFIHYGANNSQYQYTHQADGKEWHVIGMEWTADSIKIFRDYNLVYTLTNVNAIPDVSHHLCIQLDAFKTTMTGTVKMYVDWVKIYQPAQ